MTNLEEWIPIISEKLGLKTDMEVVLYHVQREDLTDEDFAEVGRAMYHVIRSIAAASADGMLSLDS